MLRVAIVGAGLMGRTHMQTARRLGATVVGVVDQDPRAATALARAIPDAQAADSLAGLIADRGFDIAHVCTPPDSHRDIGLVLAKARIAAFIEKPLADTADETRAIVKAFASSGVLLCPVHQYAFQPAVDKALAHIPKLGRITTVSFDIVSAGGKNPDDLDRTVAEILPHPLAILQRLCPAIELGELEWSVSRAEAGEWVVLATHGTVQIVISISMSSRPTNFSTRLRGTNGSIEINNFHGYAIFLPGAVSRAAKIRAPFVAAGKHLTVASGNLLIRAATFESAYPGLRTLTRKFYDAVSSGERRAAPISDGDIIGLAIARDMIIAAGRLR